MKFFVALVFVSLCFAASAQSDDKIERLPFCGWVLNKKKNIQQVMEETYLFLSPQKGDTIVDIGAQSGSFEGALAAGFGLADVSFVLVDVDARCLNQQKVENMRRHYSEVKGDSIGNRFEIVVNTQDSLHLPLNSYKKVWLLNTLHETASPQKMAHDIAAVLRRGGEACVLETIPYKEGQLHGGCRKPLLTANQTQALFLQAGLELAEEKQLPAKKKFIPVLYRFKKE